MKTISNDSAGTVVSNFSSCCGASNFVRLASARSQ